MQVRIFTIPILADEHELDELNHFLRANRVVDVKKTLAMADDTSYWTVFVTYMPDKRGGTGATQQGSERNDRVDYREELEPHVFNRFAKMRILRKQLAERDAVPAYNVFTNAELAEIAKLDVLDMAALQNLKNVGKKKIEKYGEAFCTADYDAIGNEESGKPNGENSGT